MVVQDICQQLQRALQDAGINVTNARNQRNNGNSALMMALVGMGLYPNVGARKKGLSDSQGGSTACQHCNYCFALQLLSL